MKQYFRSRYCRGTTKSDILLKVIVFGTSLVFFPGNYQHGALYELTELICDIRVSYFRHCTDFLILWVVRVRVNKTLTSKNEYYANRLNF